MAILKNVLLTVGTAPDQVSFVVKGNLKAYEDVSAIPTSGFVAKEVTDADWKLVFGVITPTIALLESGSFKRIKARQKAGKKSRELIIPAGSVPLVTAAIEASAGVTIDGILCGSVAQGLRRVDR